MKRDRLEQYVQENREAFDLHEPSGKVWKKIDSRPTSKKIFFPGNRFARVAAIFILAIAGTVTLYKSFDLLNNPYGNVKAKIGNSALNELLETEAYYAREVSGKLSEIRKCYTLYPDLEQEVENDLIELEAIYNDLRKDLKENLDNREVIEAMIQNNRIRLNLVDVVLAQLDC